MEFARSTSLESAGSEQAGEQAGEQTDAPVVPVDSPIKPRKKKKVVRAEPDVSADASATLDDAAAAALPADAADEKPPRRKSWPHRKADRKADFAAAAAGRQRTGRPLLRKTHETVTLAFEGLLEGKLGEARPTADLSARVHAPLGPYLPQKLSSPTSSLRTTTLLPAAGRD